MRGLPYVPFFTSDWLASSARLDLSLPERAIYLDLLFQIWERGGAIPSLDESKLAKLAMASPDEFRAAWPAVREHFVVHPDKPDSLANEKMLDVILRQASTSTARSRAGRSGGLASGKTRSKNEAKTKHPETELEPGLKTKQEEETTNTPASQRDAKYACVSSLDLKTTPPPRKGDMRQQWFEEWWSIYWR